MLRRLRPFESTCRRRRLVFFKLNLHTTYRYLSVAAWLGLPPNVLIALVLLQWLGLKFRLNTVANFGKLLKACSGCGLRRFRSTTFHSHETIYVKELLLGANLLGSQNLVCLEFSLQSCAGVHTELVQSVK